MAELHVHLANEAASVRLGAAFASALRAQAQGLVLWLQGDLGAGKTFFTRAVLQALDYSGIVVSPTYTLMEAYEVAGRRLLHLDLYRVGDPEELDYLGLYDQYDARDWLFIEWPEQGAAMTPVADLGLVLAPAGEGREACFMAHGERGGRLLRQLQDLNKIDGDTGIS